MKTVPKQTNQAIQRGSIFIIVGLICLMVSITLLANHFIVSGISVLIEFIGVVIIIRERLVRKEKKKLIIPIVSVGIILCMLTIYLIIIKSP